ncbi:MAG: 3-dehydroquinate synthase, partial [Planctomycetota bacterium]|nr:3-dehydroquinate synthase [Planctomycetota bacterium]
NVAPLHRARLAGLEGAPLHAVEPGEGSKRMAVLEDVLDWMAASDLDRGSVLVALGGGVVGDLGGLAASLYMRGIPVLQCPTSLLAQVDAAIGGKTAVDLAAGRNLAGTFHQPLAVLADTDVLATLPDEELSAGLGEVVKSALVGDDGLLALLEDQAERILARDTEILAEVVERCARIKAEVVAADEREAGPRRKLNLGHTYAHAIEHAAGHGRIPHGAAVGTGLCLALETGRALGLLVDRELPERIAVLIGRLGLCASLAALAARHDASLTTAGILAAMRHDKKGRAGVPALVLPRAAGDLALGVEADPDTLRAVIDKSGGV